MTTRSLLLLAALALACGDKGTPTPDTGADGSDGVNSDSDSVGSTISVPATGKLIVGA